MKQVPMVSSILLGLLLQSAHTLVMPFGAVRPRGVENSALLFAQPTKNTLNKQSRSSLLNPPQTLPTIETPPQPEADTEVYGTKFFGGSAVKEELFDAQVEEMATTLIVSRVDADETAALLSQMYPRFQDTQAFPDDLARQFGQGLQKLFNTVLYDHTSPSQEDNNNNNNSIQPSVMYSSNFQWDTPFRTAAPSPHNPLDEIQKALQFYQRLDIAIISCKTTSKTETSLVTFQVRWVMSLLWPNFIQSRVLLTGVSTLTVQYIENRFTVVSQSDRLDVGGENGRDIVEAISSQLQPRFWDLYHVGMTPSAETMSRIRPKNHKPPLFSSYSVFEIPPSLVYQTTLLDTGSRDDRNAQYIPNHAFTSFIKTMGPKEQRYIPTTPVEVQIRRGSSDLSSTSIITWTIQLCPEFISYSSHLPLVMDNVEDEEMDTSVGFSKYMYTSQRLVATLPHGGNPQDVDIAEIRKTLYENVVKDGLKPRLDDTGKPIFFYLQNDVKTCFTSEGGLGMAVYDWRPKFAKANEVGIELEIE